MSESLVLYFTLPHPFISAFDSGIINTVFPAGLCLCGGAYGTYSVCYLCMKVKVQSVGFILALLSVKCHRPSATARCKL